WSWSGSGAECGLCLGPELGTVADRTTSTTSFAVSFSDVAPSVAADSGSVSVPENTAATNTGTFSDFDDAVTITASTGSVSQVGSHSGTWSWSGSGDESSPYSVTITATNADGTTSTTSFAVSFSDVAPSVAADSGSVSVPEN